MTTCKKQPRLVDSTTIEAINMSDLEYSLKEGLKAALQLAQKGHPIPLGKLIAYSVDAIRKVERLATMRAEDLQRQLNTLKDKYEPEE